MLTWRTCHLAWNEAGVLLKRKLLRLEREARCCIADSFSTSPQWAGSFFNLHLHLPLTSRAGIAWDLEQLVAMLVGPWGWGVGLCLMPRRHFPFPDHRKSNAKYVTGEGVSRWQIMNLYNKFLRFVVTVFYVCNAWNRQSLEICTS